MGITLRRSGKQGFTIVELLIVIVVIGILAAVTIVAYNGITAKARNATLLNDLEGATKTLAIDYATNNSTYPLTAAAANNGKGLQTSGGTTLSYYYNPGDNTYCLVGTNGGITYSITSKQSTPGTYACVSVLAGSGALFQADGTGTNASFAHPTYMRLGADNLLYVRDGQGSTLIRQINPSNAVVTTVCSYSCSHNGGSDLVFQPMAVKSDGTIYVAGESPVCLYKIVSGTRTQLSCPASWSYPSGMVLAPDGYLYIADTNNNEIHKVDPANGASSVYAGSTTNGLTNGTGMAARFDGPNDIAVGSDGNFYIADCNNNLIRKMTPAGTVTTFAGSGGSGYVDGSNLQAQIYCPLNIAVDSTGALYVVDANGRIRQVSNGNVTTIAGGATYSTSAGIAASPTQSGTVYLDSYTDNKIYSLR